MKRRHHSNLPPNVYHHRTNRDGSERYRAAASVAGVRVSGPLRGTVAEAMADAKRLGFYTELEQHFTPKEVANGC